MVRIINQGGEFKTGAQGPGVYQGFYGKQMRRKRIDKKECVSQEQLEVQKRFKEGLAFAGSLSDTEKKAIIDFINVNELKMTWHNYAKLISMSPVEVNKDSLHISDSISFPVSMKAWGYRNMISIRDISGISRTNVPILISMQGTNTIGRDYFNFSLLNPDGSDIRFTENDGVSNLTYGIEQWDVVSKTARVWVKINSLLAFQTAYVFLYYENPAATPVSDLESVLYG